jgi:hypothetical protein
MKQSAIEYTLASHAVERLRPSLDAVQLCQQMEQGKIGANAAIAELLKKRGITVVKHHG